MFRVPFELSLPFPTPASSFDMFFFSSRRRHTRCYRDWSSDVCSSDLPGPHPGHGPPANPARGGDGLRPPRNLRPTPVPAPAPLSNHLRWALPLYDAVSGGDRKSVV